MNINDTNTRQQLLERFFEADTTVEEERLLAAFYREHATTLSPDEQAAAQIVLATLTAEPPLSEADMDLWEANSLAFETQKTSRTLSGKIHLTPWRMTAAVALLLIGLTGYVFRPMEKQAPQTTHLAQQTAPTLPSPPATTDSVSDKASTPTVRHSSAKSGRKHTQVESTVFAMHTSIHRNTDPEKVPAQTKYPAVEIETLQNCMALMKNCDNLALINQNDTLYMVASQPSGQQTRFSVNLSPNGEVMMLSALEP